MELNLLIKGLVEAAKSPLSFVAYMVIAVFWIGILWKESRINNLIKSLKLLPEDKRLEALQLEYKLIPKDGLNPQQFLLLERRKYFFLAFAITLLAALIIAALGFYRFIQLDRLNVAGESMRIAFETFIRGTTTADNNRFNEAIGKLEESVTINPSYSGYVNLADIYEQVGEPDRALWASQKAAELDPTNPSPENLIGAILKDQGRLDEAETHLLRAQELFAQKNIRDDEFQVTMLVNLGNIYYQRADKAADPSEKERYARIALDRYFNPALALRGGLQNKRFLANILGNTANTYRILKEFSQAETLMIQSISMKEQIAKSSPEWNSLGIGYFNLSDIYLKQGLADKTEKYVAMSEEIFSKAQYAVGLGSVSLARAELAKMEGDIQNAREYAEQARQIFLGANMGLYADKATKFIEQL